MRSEELIVQRRPFVPRKSQFARAMNSVDDDSEDLKSEELKKKSEESKFSKKS